MISRPSYLVVQGSKMFCDNFWDMFHLGWLVIKKLWPSFWQIPNRGITFHASVFRSSRLQMFYKKGVLKHLNTQKFKQKHLCRSLSFNTVVDLQAGILFKKETVAQVFSCEFCKILKNTHFIAHLRVITFAFWKSNNRKQYKEKCTWNKLIYMLCMHIERELNFDCLSHVENTSVNELTKLFFAIEYDFFVFLSLFVIIFIVLHFKQKRLSQFKSKKREKIFENKSKNT